MPLNAVVQIALQTSVSLFKHSVSLSFSLSLRKEYVFLQGPHLIRPSSLVHDASSSGDSVVVAEIASACYWPITYGNCWQVLLTFTTRSFIPIVGHM